MRKQSTSCLSCVTAQNVYAHPMMIRLYTLISTTAPSRACNTFYLERAHFAQAVRTLAAMGVAAQAYDFIFAAPLKNVEEDQAFIDATQKAGNVYFGLAMTLGNRGQDIASTAIRGRKINAMLSKRPGRWPYRVISAHCTSARTR